MTTPPLTPRQVGRAVAWPLLVAAGAVVGAAMVAVRDPNVAGSWGTCPILAATGWHCPGCGTLRAVHALTQGDVPLAMSSNAATMLLLMVFSVGWLAWFRRRARGLPGPVAIPNTFALTVLAGLPLFMLLRNTPWLSVLAP